MSCDEAIKYEISDKYKNDQLKFVIIGTTAEIQTAMKLPRIKELQKKYKVVPKDTQHLAHNNTQLIERKSFRDRLIERLENPKTLEVFQELFGTEK